ncbi:MAG: SRPBCC family protein [Geodermatophilaceae bacterium]|nr:SRPBCC family protein [Geodermatophilaceae bacterium]
MITVERQVATAAPLSKVAAYLSDFTNTADWDPHTEECVRLDNGPLRTGAHYRNVQKVAGRSSELHYKLVDYRPEEQVKVIGQGKNVKATDTMIFDAEEGGGTLVTYRAEFVFSGASRLAEPLGENRSEQGRRRRCRGHAARDRTVDPYPDFDAGDAGLGSYKGTSDH